MLVAVLTVVVLPVCAVAQEPAGEGGPSQLPIGDLGQAIAAILIFLVLLGALGKWAWKPLIHQLQQREQVIADSIERAEQREQEAEDLLSHYRRRLETARSEADELMERTRREADAQREEMLEQARQDARRLAEEAKEAIEHAREEALRELYDSTARLATDIAGRVMRRELDAPEQQRLLEESLQQIRQRMADHKPAASGQRPDKPPPTPPQTEETQQ